MIYGKIWLVVKPSVGVPLFLSAVAVSSFAVHYMLLTHTTWLPAYYEGKAEPKSASLDALPHQALAPPQAGTTLAAATVKP